MKLRVLLVLMLFALTASAQLRVRAERAYEAREWPSAHALYMLVSEEEPTDATPYGRAAVAALMQGDSTVTAGRIETAMSHGVPLDSVLAVIEHETIALGQSTMYERELLRTAAALPYLQRPLQSRLLAHYLFRRDAANIIRYATVLLRGIPDNTTWLNSLAQGYLLAGDMQAAIDTWRRTLNADSDNIEALIYLGNALLPDDRAAALPYLIRANELQPSDYLRNIISK